MKSLIVLICAALFVAAVADTTTTSDLLLPQPSSMQFGSNVYAIDSSFVFAYNGATSNILTDAFSRYNQIIFDTPVPFYPSGGSTEVAGTLSMLQVTLASNDETLGLDTDESYTLTVTGGKGAIMAQNPFGALRGLETFSQLVYITPDKKLAINEVTQIQDKPRFNYRGAMIDTSRHFLNMKTILSHLDAMSYNKFNVLHWHIVDDQSFPYTSRMFPNITKQGAYDENHVYTQDNVAKVIQYARERGIRVIPEFDTPGHSQSWGIGQLGLLTPCYSNGKPTGEFGPINPVPQSTWTFMESFYKELVNVFPDDYIHLGGDEVSFSCWESNPDIQKWMQSKGYTNYAKLEEYYENNLLDLVSNLKKSYVVWQEIFDNGLKIKMDTVIDVWKGEWQKEMNAVTKAGYKVILSSCWYLNYITYGEDWKNYYICDPQNFNGTEQQNSLVVGGHACIWGEYVDSTNFLTRYWPRASAVAERLWSPKTVTDINSATRRLHNQKCRLMSRDIPSEPITGPGHCSYEWPNA